MEIEDGCASDKKKTLRRKICPVYNFPTDDGGKRPVKITQGQYEYENVLQ